MTTNVKAGFHWKLKNLFFIFLSGATLALSVAASFPQAARALEIGGKATQQAAKKPLPNLTLPTLDGKKWSLDKQRGRVVAMNFWATWCLPCHEEIPILVSLSKKYKKDGLEIVGISIDSDRIEEIKKFVGKFKVSYPILLTNPDSLLARREAVPMTLLINENGSLVEKIVGAADENFLETEIRKLLSRLPAGKKTKSTPAKKK